MAAKQDQQRVKDLLTDAITVLCKNGLNYKSEFCIEGLLGITLDNHDIVLINIKETVKSVNQNASPNPKDPLAPLDLMVLNSVSLNDVHTTIGEDLSVKNTSLTSTPGKKHNTSICSYLDRLDAGCDTGIKGDNSWNFALNYALYDDVIEDLSMASGKRFQGLSMDDLAVFDNDMGEIMDKNEVGKENETVTSSIAPQKPVVDKVSCLKQEMSTCFSGIEPMEQAETLNLSAQDVLSLATEQPANILTPEKSKDVEKSTNHSPTQLSGVRTQAGDVEELPLNLSEPKKKKAIKKKLPCPQCKKSFKTEASLNKHKCKGQGSSSASSETSQPLDLTVGRLEGEDGPLLVGADGMVNMETVLLQQDQPQSPQATVVCEDPLNNNNEDIQYESRKENSPTELDNHTPQALPDKVVILEQETDSMAVDDDQETYVCICNKTLPDYDSYLDHMALCPKSRQTPYKSCEVCGKYLFSSSGYVKHKRLHMGAFKFWCNVCQKGFFDRTHLNAHMDASHSKVRRYVCNICDKKFFWKHHLKRHLVSCNKANKSESSSCSRTSPSVETTKTSGQDTLTMNWDAD